MLQVLNEHVTLGHDVLYFVSSYYRFFVQHFDRVDLLLGDVSRLEHTTEASFADLIQELKIGRLGFGIMRAA